MIIILNNIAMFGLICISEQNPLRLKRLALEAGAGALKPLLALSDPRRSPNRSEPEEADPTPKGSKKSREKASVI